MDEFCVTKDWEEETTMIWTIFPFSGVNTSFMERFGEDSFRLSAKYMSGPQIMAVRICNPFDAGPLTSIIKRNSLPLKQIHIT